MPDFTGQTERDYIMSASTGIGALAGGRVFKTAVPDEENLPRLADGKIKPYLVVTFQSPFSGSQGRSVAGGEQKQPHIMSGMAVSFAGDPDSAEALDNAVKRKLVGLIPSSGATPIRLVGGFSYDNSDTSSKPTRFAAGTWFKFHMNLDPTP